MILGEVAMAQINLEGKAIAGISKLDNGYVVTFIEVPQCKAQHEPLSPEAAEERLNSVLDGMVEFNKHLRELAEGETWKQDAEDTRQRLREAFMRMNPGILQRLQPPPCPRVEKRVFVSKGDLLTYLAECL